MGRDNYFRKRYRRIFFYCLCGMGFLFTLSGQEYSKWNFNASVDWVSQNVWRGMYQAPSSIQPEMCFGYKNCLFSVWGTTDFRGNEYEIDLTFSYEWGNVSLGFTDYWFGTNDNSYLKNHWVELQGMYHSPFCPLSIGWNTLCYGGQNHFSSYMELAYSPVWKNWAWEIGLGISPWQNELLETDRFALCKLSFSGNREVRFPSGFSFVYRNSLQYNPDRKSLYWIAGISIPFF